MRTPSLSVRTPTLSFSSKMAVHGLALVYLLMTSVFVGEGYNPLTGKFYCETLCWHEIGHAVDHRMGWVSQSEAFVVAVEVHMRVEVDEYTVRMAGYPGVFGPRWQDVCDVLSYCFFEGGWGGYYELYADMLAWAGGDRARMPERFQEFYDWRMVSQYGLSLGP